MSWQGKSMQRIWKGERRNNTGYKYSLGVIVEPSDINFLKLGPHLVTILLQSKLRGSQGHFGDLAW
jgi:hypothetical protein